MAVSVPNQRDHSLPGGLSRGHSDCGFLAVMSSHCDCVGSARWIVYGADAAKYVAEVATNMAAPAEMLTEHFWDHVAASDLHLQNDSLNGEPGAEDYPDFNSVVSLVRRIPQLAQEEFERTRVALARPTRWYTGLVEFLNDAFPADSGVWIDIEGPIDVSLSELLVQEAERYSSYAVLTESEAAWLGRLAVASRRNWKPPIKREQWQALHRLVAEFNEENQFS